MRCRLARIRRDNRGAAAVEFALWSALFFVVALAGLDLADVYFKQSQIGSAVSAASIQAFAQRDSVDFAAIPDYVRSVAELSDLTVTVACNGIVASCTNTARTCACLNQSGAFTAVACAQACTGSGMTSGVNAGYYLTITASRAVTPLLLSSSLTGRQISQTVTVRLQ